jgi:hypothetical protein
MYRKNELHFDALRTPSTGRSATSFHAIDGTIGNQFSL